MKLKDNRPLKQIKNIKDVYDFFNSERKPTPEEKEEIINNPKNWKPKIYKYGDPVSHLPRETKQVYTVSRIIKPELNLDGINCKKESTDINRKRKVLALINELCHIRSRNFNYATEVTMPVRRKKFQRKFGSIADVSRVIKDACDLGILSEFNIHYEWIGPTTISPDFVHPCAKTYLIHPENECLFREYCKLNGIEPWTAEENKTNKTLAELAETFYPSKNFEIDSNIVINQRTNIKRKPYESKEKTEFRVKQTLLVIYPFLRTLQKNIKIINSTLNDSDLELTAEPNFTWNKKETKIIKVGLRVYCPACSVPKKFNPNVEYTHGLPYLDRNDMLTKKGLTGSENDVKSSVPRLSNFIHTGVFMPFIDDCYEILVKISQGYTDSKMKKEKWNEELRKISKKLFMLLNFSSSWEKANHSVNFTSEYTTDNISERIKQNYLFNFDKAIEEFTGNKGKSSFIFLVESCICTAVTVHLVKNGYKVFMCYDGFYTDKPLSHEKFEKLITHYAYEFEYNYPELFDNISINTITNNNYNNDYIYNNINYNSYTINNIVKLNVNSNYKFYNLWCRNRIDDRYVRKKEKKE